MGAREKLNENKKLGVGVGLATLIVAIGAIAFQLSGGQKDGSTPPASSAFYTDDNGKTFFKDDLSKVPPFNHNGKTAFRADVFQGADGKQFVGLIYRFTASGRREMEGYLSQKVSDPDGMVRASIEQRGMQVKRPAGSEAEWAIADDAMIQRLQGMVKDSTGKRATLVTP